MDLDKVIIFDGICNFCSNAVRFIINRDSKATYRFIPMQTELGRQLLAQYGYDPDNTQTFLLLTTEGILDRTDAALEILKAFSWHWQSLRILQALPKPFRDWFYDVLARNRYRWFGKKDTCMIPSDEIKSRFLT
jgi:predicted DCC family thiol-disulfide oxidoreductase YuxK